MGERRNITLSLPKEILQRVRHIAVDRHISVSMLMAEMLEDLVRREDAYVQARERQDQMMHQGFDLGTEGNKDWTRDDLHER